MEKKRVSNRIIAYEASLALASFLHRNIDNRDEKRELRAVMSGNIVANRSVLNWIEDRARRAYTVLWLDISPKDRERRDLDKEVLRVCIECISRYPHNHPCFEEYLSLFPELGRENGLAYYEELDKELEKAKFAEEEERGDV